MFESLEDLVDKDKPGRVDATIALMCSIALVIISLSLTFACMFKNLNTVTISAYGFLSAHAFLTYRENKG